MIKNRKVAYQEINMNDSKSNESNSDSGDSNDNTPPVKLSLALTPIKSTKVKIPMNAIIYMEGKPLPPIPPQLIVYHKPKNVLSAMDERHSVTKQHLGMFLPENYKKFGMHPVGRLGRYSRTCTCPSH